MPETSAGSKPAPKPGARKKAPRKAKTAGKTITIEQYRSGIQCVFTHKRTLKSLGLKRMRQRVVRPDNPAVRGMVESIPHLVRIVEA
jgi:large subunit ribosomal protein L30